MNRKAFFKRGLAAIAGIVLGVRAAPAAPAKVAQSVFGMGSVVPRFGINPEWCTALWSQVRMPDGTDAYLFSGSQGGSCREYFLERVEQCGGTITGMRASLFSEGYFESGEAIFQPIEPFIRLPDVRTP